MCTASHWTNGQDLLGRGGEARTGTDDAGGVEPWARSRSAAVSRGLPPIRRRYECRGVLKG